MTSITTGEGRKPEREGKSAKEYFAAEISVKDSHQKAGSRTFLTDETITNGL